MDTIGKLSRKENLEKELDQVEKDIKKLQKNYIFVDTTAPSSTYWWIQATRWNEAYKGKSEVHTSSYKL